MGIAAYGMMDANSLMQGNIVRLNNPEFQKEFTGRLCIVQGTQANHVNGSIVWLKVAGNLPLWQECVSELCQYEKFIDPVELSPTVIDACGFENYAGELCLSTNDDFVLKSADDKGRLWYVAGCLIDGGSYLQYLHQLQNIYFALMGDALQINIEKLINES